nr:putative RNA-dependent RNA polymerase [Poaceae Liege totivirus 17]
MGQRSYAGRPTLKGFSGSYCKDDNGRNTKNREGRQQNQKKLRFTTSSAPACISHKGGNWWLTPFEDATHVLLDSVTRTGDEIIEMVHNYMGTSVDALYVPAGEFALVYAKVDQEMFTPNNGVMAVMTRHFNGLYESVNYDDPTSTEALFRDRSGGVSENKVMTPNDADAAPKSKISAAHHFHYYPAEVAASLSNERRKEAMDALRLPSDATLPFYAGWLLWCGTAPVELVQGARRAGLTAARSTKEFIAMAKSLSVEAKSLQNLVEADLRPIFELDVLVNRTDGVVDWEAEKRNRTELNVTNISRGDIFARAVAVFGEARGIGRRPNRMTWKEYWESRWQWSAAGSIHSQHAEDLDYVIKTDPALKNKFIAMANMPELGIEYFASRPAEIHGWASTKYEWAKQRAIYGTDLTSYTLANFAFYNCENVLPRQFPVGADANDRNVQSRVAGVLENRVPFCLDFEDFNSQHSASSMAAVIDAYLAVYDSDMTAEQVEAVKWTRDSVARQVIHDNIGLKELYEARGTLLSGWRLTTFMNSVLNYIYTLMLAGEQNKVKSSLHNGDDVLMGTRTLGLPQQCMKNARKYNIRMQTSKCAYGAIAEFLRIDHRRGSRGQYLARAISTLMHSRIESRISTDARDLVQSMENRFTDAADRGMELRVITMLRELYYRRQSVICGNTLDEMYLIKTTHRAAGGISEAQDARVDVLIEPGELGQQGVVLPRLPGVVAYARLLDRTLKLQVTSKEMERRVEKATYEAVVTKNRTMSVTVGGIDEWYARVKSIYKAHKGAVRVQNYGKAALVGFGLELLGREAPDIALVAILNASVRPLELLPHIV